MRTRLLLLFAFAAATVLMNVASAGNIAHGVEVVVIDAGHGGKFPGAHYGGVYEKDLTLKVALGQFTPPLAVNLMVSCRIAGVRMESTVRWVGWMLLSGDAARLGEFRAALDLLSALRLIGNRLRDQRTEWERPPHKPVAQQNMGAGTVELF